MKRCLKIHLSLSLVLLALAASSGVASAYFTSDGTGTTVQGSNTNVHHWKTGVFDVTCATGTFDAYMAGGTVTSLTVTANYGSCHAIILFTFSAEVQMNSCHYQWDQSGNYSIKCTKAADKIRIASAGCTIELGEQIIANGASFTTNTEAAKKRIEFISTAKGIKYSQSGSSCSTKEGTDAEYTGSAILSGTSGGVAVNVTIS